jgi:hypothetical protein
MRGLLRAFAEIGVDCIDAATPAPLGDLTPSQCRDEAGKQLILSGGVPPDLWLSQATDEEFTRAVIDWLELRKRSPRLGTFVGGFQAFFDALADKVREQWPQAVEIQ